MSEPVLTRDKPICDVEMRDRMNIALTPSTPENGGGLAHGDNMPGSLIIRKMPRTGEADPSPRETSDIGWSAQTGFLSYTCQGAEERECEQMPRFRGD